MEPWLVILLVLCGLAVFGAIVQTVIEGPGWLME